MVYGVGWRNGAEPQQNHNLIDILSLFSSFHMITGRVLSFSIIFQHIFASFCPFSGVFPPLPPKGLGRKPWDGAGFSLAGVGGLHLPKNINSHKAEYFELRDFRQNLDPPATSQVTAPPARVVS